MGGPGSGQTLARSAAKKTTVEDLLVLTTSALVHRKALVPGARTAGLWSWSFDGEGRPFATIGYEVDLTDESDAWLRVHYQANGEPLDYKNSNRTEVYLA